MICEAYELYINIECRYECYGTYFKEMSVHLRNADLKFLIETMKHIANDFIDEVIDEYGISITKYGNNMMCITSINNHSKYIERHMEIMVYDKKPYLI